MAPEDRKPLNVCFIHIPKCAGVSVVEGFRQAIPGEGYWHCHVFPAVAAYLAARDLPYEENEAAFETFHLEMRQFLLLAALHSNYKILAGHMPFSPLAADKMEYRYRFYTVLRDPVERFISHAIYLNFRHLPHEPPPDFEMSMERVEALLTDEVGRMMARSYTLYLGGLTSEGKAELAGVKERALQHLGKFAVVGFQENFPAWDAVVSRSLGTRYATPRLNQQSDVIAEAETRRKVRAFFTPARRAQIAEMCAEDQEIYAAACAAFPETAPAR